MIPVAMILMIILCTWCIYIDRKSANQKQLSVCGRVLITAAITGFIGAIIVTIIFITALKKLDAGGADVARDAFILFLKFDGVLVLALLTVTVTASLIRHNMAVGRKLIAFLGSLIVLILAYVFSLLSDYKEINVSLYITAEGISLALLLTLSPALDILCIARQCKTTAGHNDRISVLKSRRAPSLERSRIKSAKRRASSKR